MVAETLDYRIERQRHDGFIGRAAVLAELDRLLLEQDTDRWVVVIGGPGMGKSAILAAWLSRREAAGARIPHHFIRRGFYRWDDSAVIVRSLAAQVEALFPAQRDPDARPESRLVDLLARVSTQELVPSGKRLVLLIDGLDEYDAPTTAHDPFAEFLPHALPRGVRFLCTSRPRHPYLDALEARHGSLARIDLDDPAAAHDNDATVRAFWRREAAALRVDEAFIDEAVARACGNLQYAATLRKHLESVPHAQRCVELVPRGLKSLLAMLWQRVACDPIAICGLGILCAAREPVSLDELSAVAGWDGVAYRRRFVQLTSELLVETRREDSVAEYRLHHDSIRGHIVEELGPAAMRDHHAALAHKLATWPAPADPIARRYALRHAITHRADAGHWPEVVGLAGNVAFLEAKYREIGSQDAEADVLRAAQRCRSQGDAAIARELCDLARALTRESHWISSDPGLLAAQLWNRLKRMGWTTEALARRLALPPGAALVRVRRVISRESPALLRELTGHARGVTACVVTSDGRRVISASNDRTLKIWDLDTGRIVATLDGHGGGVNSCAVTPDGRRVVSASDDYTLKIWDVDTACAILTLEGHTAAVNGCAVTPDGGRVVSASDDRTLRVWELSTGKLVAILEGHDGHVNGCAIADDGCAVSASSDRTVRLWALDTGRAIAILEGHTGDVCCCCVIAGRARLVSASGDRTLRIWDLDTYDLVSTLEGPLEVSGCAATPDGRRLISASGDGTLRIWDIDTGRIVATLDGHTGMVQGCTITPDGRRVVSASSDRTLKIWALEAATAATLLEGHTAAVQSCAITSDQRRMISASDDRTLKIWSLDTGGVVTTLEGHAGRVHGCAVSRDGRRVVSASDDRTLKVWDDGGRVVSTLEGHAGDVNSCVVTPDGTRAISASGDRTLKVWDLRTGHQVCTLDGHTGDVNSCAMTPDGRCVISASIDKTLKVWDLASRQAIFTLEGHTDWVRSCAVTADGQCVVSASDDTTLKIWDLETGRSVTTLEGHTGRVQSCSVTADRVVSASGDKTLKIWDLKTHECLATHHGDTSFTAVAATPGAICAGDDAGALWILDWPSPAEVAQAIGPPRKRAGIASTGRREPMVQRPRHVILFLAANPCDTSELALGKECAAIERELRVTPHRHDFSFHSKWAVTVDDMRRHLMELQPTIVHFSGHGLGDPAPTERLARRDVGATSAGRGGICLLNEHGASTLVSAKALTMMFRFAASSTRIVVLNACYSDGLADELRTAVECVVGMTGAISDDAARAFAVCFYGALGHRRSVGNAVENARTILATGEASCEQLPRCRTHDGVDADEVLLACRSPRQLAI